MCVDFRFDGGNARTDAATAVLAAGVACRLWVVQLMCDVDGSRAMAVLCRVAKSRAWNCAVKCRSVR
jgi:hypothetical protein